VIRNRTPGAPSDTPEWALQVNRGQFAQALRVLSRAARAVRDAEAILRLDAAELCLELAACSCRVPAVGTWPSEVRLAGETIGHLARSVPDDDPLPVTVKGDRIYLARFSIPCKWRSYSRQPGTPVPEMIPANAELFEILMARARCSAAEIDAAGAAPLVAGAEKLLKEQCAKAAGILRRYRVTAGDLETLCQAHIDDGSRHFLEADRGTIRQISAVWEILAPLGVEPAEIKDLMDSRLRSAWKK
jgi:hypothetical protein